MRSAGTETSRPISTDRKRHRQAGDREFDQVQGREKLHFDRAFSRRGDRRALHARLDDLRDPKAGVWDDYDD